MNLRKILLLGTTLLALTLVVCAQEHQPPQQPQQPAKQDTVDRADQHQKPGEKLDQAASEAAAEDPHAEFKESRSVQWVANTLGISLSAAYWVSVILNFAVVAAAIWLVMRKVNVAGSMRERTAAIRRQMEEAQRASEEAARRMSDIETRLASLDQEISGLRAQAEQEAAREEARLLAAAEEEKRKVVAGAEQEIAAAAKAARAELRAYTAELAVGLAEKKIEVNEPTDQALLSEFVEQLGKDGR
jgi:F-type H+-transporting ATPase subunit b